MPFLLEEKVLDFDHKSATNNELEFLVIPSCFNLFQYW